MAKRGRPFAYESDEERPVTVSMRLTRDLHKQVERYVKMHPGMTFTEFMLDAIRLRLDTPADPRDIILSDDNTVIQELQEMIQTSVQREIAKLRDFIQPLSSLSRVIPPSEAPAEPVPELSHDDNTVIQETEETALADAPYISSDYNTVLQEAGEQEQEAHGSPSVHDDKDLSRRDIEPPTRRGVPKLTPRQVKALRAKRARGVPVKALMEEYSLSKATVFRYLAEA
jgi:hypothetical protein